MSCCGKKLGTIIKGNAIHLAIDLLKMPSGKYEFADDRLYKCWECEHQTWLTRTEYLEFVLANAKEIIKHLDDLTQLPPLPVKVERKRGRLLFCSLCKCFIPAKTYIEDEKCPIDDNW